MGEGLQRALASESPGLLNMFSNLFIVVVYMAYLVAIEDGTHIGSATASFKDLVTVSHKSENSTKQTAELSAGHSRALLNYLIIKQHMS